MALTLEDIAQISGVSRSTVSRVVNGDEKVSADTRKRVLDVIQAHNFQPNMAARRLAAGRTNVIGLVIPTGGGNIFNDPYFSRLIQGISSECNLREYSLMLWLAEPEFEQRMIRQVISNGVVDGVVVSSNMINDPIITSLQNSRMPFTLIGHHPSVPASSIDIDNVQAAFLAANHFFHCSTPRQRIATITGPQNTIAGSDRLEGYRRALKANGHEIDRTLIAEGNFSENSGYRAMKQLLATSRPDAVFAASDMMAAGAYKAIREEGYQIPEEIAVIGCDDVSIAAQLTPALTTIRQPIQNIGEQAVQVLINELQQTHTQPSHTIIQPELILRGSCGCEEQANKAYMHPTRI